jgi:hypothetical protein
MVLYHWLNYFVDLDQYYYRYLRFLTPSFIFITGFLISHVYLRDFRIVHAHVPRRLFVRGLKLLAVFAALNVIPALVSGGSRAVTDWPVYLGFSNSSARVSFSVLIPIACVLLVASALSVAVTRFRAAFPVAAALSVAVAGISHLAGQPNAFLELISIGLIGILIGSVPLSTLMVLLDHRAVIVLSYLGYVCAITVWHEAYVLQVLGVCLTLALIYIVGANWNNRVALPIVLLGKYSLLGYIAQIAILRMLHRALQHTAHDKAVALGCLAIGTGMTFVSVMLVDRARARYHVINKTYSLVFS